LSPVLFKGVEAVAVPFCTRTAPFIEMALFCPGALGFADDKLGDEDDAESDGLFCPGALGFADDEDEPESAGLADAAQGVAASPTPMPSATANAPTRPIYPAYPAWVCFA